MVSKKYIYSLSYDNTESDLCKLEAKYLFETLEQDRLIFSDKKFPPSNSALIKSRIDVLLHASDYQLLVSQIKELEITIEKFKVEYLVLSDDPTPYKARLGKLRDVGFSIKGEPDYYHPTTTYVICMFQNIWYFGVLNRDDFSWHKHRDKPHSYSNSIGTNVAKALVNIAAAGDKSKTLIDGCCGVGTIMLEACFADYSIEGCEMNWRICHNARKNLVHFDYTAEVYRSDIRDIAKRYDAAILDLPYNHVTYATESDVLHIIESAAKITDRLVIVSTSDIVDLIRYVGFYVTDQCSVSKRGKRKFARKVWVCEKIS